MFSEYASRFLAQSQSRISFAAIDDRRSVDGRARRQNQSIRATTTSRGPIPRAPNPYQPTSSQLSAFPFASRLNPQQAPLFYSATDEFREENDEEEHEREIADYYALQRSRRQLGASDLKESADAGDASGSSVIGASSHEQAYDELYGRPGGIKSSWHGGNKVPRRKHQELADLAESTGSQPDTSSPTSSRGPMVDVKLANTIRSDYDDDPPEDLMENPPSVQHLRQGAMRVHSADDSGDSEDESASHRLLHRSGSLPADELLVQNSARQGQDQQPKHDFFFGQIYLLALAAMFTTWFLVFLHTEPPGTGKPPMGDTIYTTLHGSFYLLATYTLVATFVSLFWLAALRSYVRHLVYGIVIAVPVILYSFSLYPFISSFRGAWHGSSIQDVIMRWSALIPAALATLWILACFRGRMVMQKSIAILEFATRILAANPALVLVGFGVLGFIISFTWIWLSMFTRVFLGGHPSTRSAITKFVIDTSTWWVGVYFVVIYLWTIAIAFGFQRTVTSATVSQWYFHRLAVPAPTSQAIIKAALLHSATTLFGTIALFTALGLLVRLPLLVLPRRLTMLIGIAMYSLIPSPITVLINPLTLTYAAIHSQPLRISARGLSQMHYLAPGDATTSLHPNTFGRRNRDGWSGDASPLLPYRLAKLVLHATRFIMSLALGFGGWVSTARTLKLEGAGARGSLYAYVVGLIAGAIGWGILGAMEGVLASIVDAVVVCWGSEVGSSGQGEVRYCREAGHLFGEDDTVVGPVSLA